MSAKPSFARKVQCAACPWKRATNPHRDIPGGYLPELHARLDRCRSEGLHDTGIAMACHESPPRRPQACVGWVINQLGPGNNMPLRLAAMTGQFDAAAMVVEGEQYETLEEMVATHQEDFNE